MRKLEIWTDGGCIGNGHADATGAWAFVCSNGHEASGRVECTTNNRTELLAVIEALRYAANQGCDVATVHSDSQLTIKCAMRIWKRKKNLDLWLVYEEVKALCRPEFVWVRGHSGDVGNERADELCRLAMEGRAIPMVPFEAPAQWHGAVA